VNISDLCVEKFEMKKAPRLQALGLYLIKLMNGKPAFETGTTRYPSLQNVWLIHIIPPILNAILGCFY